MFRREAGKKMKKGTKY